VIKIDRKVRLGFIGCGWMGQRVHLRNFLKIDSCEVVAICDQRKELCDGVAKRFHIPKAYYSHKELIEKEELDAVAAIAMPQLHEPSAIDCLNAGLHVYTEKPIATCSARAAEMVKAAKKNNVKLMVANMKRYDPGVNLAKEIIEGLDRSKELGKRTYARVHYFCGDWICGFSEPMVERNEPSYDYWAGLPKSIENIEPKHIKNFTSFQAQFCHATNLIRYLWGDPSEVTYANLYDFDNDSYSGHTLLKIGDIQCALESGRVKAHFWDEEYKIYFERGWVEIKAPPPLLQQQPAKIEVYKCTDNKTSYEHPISPWGWSFEEEARYFIDCVLKDKEPRTPGYDCYKDIYLCERIYMAYRQKKPIKLDYSF
jgi:predicted dehydrogenase